MFELTRRNHNKPAINPFAALEEMERQFFSHPFPSFFETGMMDAFKTDIRDEGDKYELEADLPGSDKKDIKIDINEKGLKSFFVVCSYANKQAFCLSHCLIFLQKLYVFQPIVFIIVSYIFKFLKKY